jgi:hypothetical protein
MESVNTIQCSECNKIVKIKNFVPAKGKAYKCGTCSRPRTYTADKEVEDEYVGMKHKYDLKTRYGVGQTKLKDRGSNKDNF